MSCIFLHENLFAGFQELFVPMLLHKLLATRVKLLKGAKVLLFVDISQFIKLLTELIFQVRRQTQEFSIQYSVIKMSL